jgi:hypothetical protein
MGNVYILNLALVLAQVKNQTEKAFVRHGLETPISVVGKKAVISAFNL